MSSQLSTKQPSSSEGRYLKQNKFAAYGHKITSRSGSNNTPDPGSKGLGMVRLDTLPPKSERSSSNLRAKDKKKSRVNVLYPGLSNANPYEN